MRVLCAVLIVPCKLCPTATPPNPGALQACRCRPFCISWGATCAQLRSHHCSFRAKQHQRQHHQQHRRDLTLKFCLNAANPQLQVVKCTRYPAGRESLSYWCHFLLLGFSSPLRPPRGLDPADCLIELLALLCFGLGVGLALGPVSLCFCYFSAACTSDALSSWLGSDLPLTGPSGEVEFPRPQLP